MDHTEDVVRGVLKPDGTLELAGRPNLPAGAVEVVVRTPGSRGQDFGEASSTSPPVAERIDVEAGASHHPAEGYGPYLARIRARREAEGFPFRTREEIDAEIEDLRSSEEDRRHEIPHQC